MEMEEFYKFLSRKSVLGIINSLAKDKPLQFKDIKSGFDISDKTVFRITSELLEFNLVKKTIIVREGKHVDVYELTELGKDIHSLLEQIQQRFKEKKVQLDYDEENVEDFDVFEIPSPQERRELLPREKERIHDIIESIIKANDMIVQERWVNELYKYSYHELEKKTDWYSNKELFNFISSVISGKYSYKIMRGIFPTLQRIFIDVRKDKVYRKKWVKQIFPLLQDMLKDYSIKKEIRLEVIEIIEEMKNEKGNLLSEVLNYFFLLHRDYYDSEYFNSDEYGYFGLDNRICVNRTKEEQEKISTWIEGILQHSGGYTPDEDLREEYHKIYGKIAKMG